MRALRVALTGGIATGKSTCLERFAEHGARTIDADAIARAVVGPGTATLAAVAGRFGPSVVRSDGCLDRAALARIAFADLDARRDLERIIHPAVYTRIDEWYAVLDREAAGAGGHPAESVVGIADIPLLFETGREGDFDCVVVAACQPDQQVARLMRRDGLDETSANQRIAAQWPVEEKARRADFVIDTSGALDGTRQRTDEVWKALESGTAP